MSSNESKVRNTTPSSASLPLISSLGLSLLQTVAVRAPALGIRLARLQAAMAWWSAAVREGSLANAGRLGANRNNEENVEKIARAIVRNWYRAVFESARNSRRDFRDLLPEIDQVVGREQYGRARATGRGLIVATAHLGPFEILAAALRQYEPKIHAVIQRERHAGLESLRAAQFRRLGIVEAAVEDGYDVWVSVKAALERDEVVLIHADHVLHGQRGAKVKFASGHITVPTTPIKLAMQTRSPIVPMFAVRTSPTTSRVYFEPPLKIEAGPSEEGGVHPACSLWRRSWKSTRCSTRTSGGWSTRCGSRIKGESAA